MFVNHMHDVKRILLLHLNYRGHANYSILKRKQNGRVIATVYYDYKGKTYRLGCFALITASRIGSDFIKHKYGYLDPATTFQIESATNRFLKQFKVLQVMQKGDLL